MEFCNCKLKHETPSTDGRHCTTCGKWYGIPKEPGNIPSYEGQAPEPGAEGMGVEAEKKIVSGQHINENKDRYGVKGNRSRTQWANLVADYGREKVCDFEGLTPAQLRKKINTSFSDQLKEKFRQQRLGNAKSFGPAKIYADGQLIGTRQDVKNSV